LIRPAEASDADAIATAERICFSDPWTLAGIRELFRSGTTMGLLAVDSDRDGRIAGYLFARTIAGEGEILNLAVLPEVRRHGIGRRLLEVGLAELTDRGSLAVFLEVRQSNQSAQDLYRSVGFEIVGVRPDYYRSPREDALVLRRTAPVAKT
jgi:ribosomal-protein-alanine N-acetyltransferase